MTVPVRQMLLGRNNLCEGESQLIQMLNKRRPADQDLFDESSGYDEEVGVRLAPNLSIDEIRQANMLYHLFNELWGVCLVVGDPGTGKDLFGNYLTYKIKRYFPWKRILRDEKPRALFGEYAGLFNEQVLKDDLKAMRAIASGTKVTEVDGVMEKAADDWIKGAGEVLLKNSVLYLTEFWRYCYNREPHNPMNKTMGAIHKVKRHIDCLIIGTGQLATELDKKTCLPWIDWKVTCTRSTTNKTGFVYFVTKVKYDRREDILLPVGRPFPIAFDAAKPRSEMGDGKIVLLKPNYEPWSEEEQVVLNVLKAGVNVYEDIVNLLGTEGDPPLSENEVLATLKELKLNKRKRVVDFPCYFGLYNSKSAPNIKTNVHISD